jgi:CubicO group peptidase (beta-lactamase class C family)
MQLDDTIPFLLRYFSHHNPFVQDVEGLLAIARRATLTNRGGFVYSNLGVALLGHALAAAAQRDYAQLLQERLLTPLGMAETSLTLTAENLPAGAPSGYSAAGIAQAPWPIDGWAPAGGARSTAADMVRYAQALLDGTAPGMDALRPRWQFGEQQIGYVWTTQEYGGHTVTFKNGLTGGFTSKIILDRAHQRAVIVLSNTAAQVDEAANRLLVGEQAWISSQ